MTINVHMLAYMNDTDIRPVELPPDYSQREFLHLVFHYGQNDFCNNPAIRFRYCPVSVGDVIEKEEGVYYLVRPAGFGKMTPEEFVAYKTLNRHDRIMFAYDWKKEEE